ncbi:cysteine-rich hydrophobic domain-containing protein 2 isoform X1 [Hydra vulgaris]|uniref:Cysteine-rich hydrophobic domain 2 protein n=1 Tax=Hydra vulgaris TaxID=6087 RepID=T2M3V8_HYDVU|nr:cysteine-rich hydrophobic domain-containing protein 2 [Hydra vulgaris]
MERFDMIEDALQDYGDGETEPFRRSDPIRISGVGHLTLFGLSNKFETDFPSGLTGKLAPEEYDATLSRINKVLGRSLPTNLRWLFCGCLCCCCTLGMSIWPVVFLNKRTRHQLEKIIDSENRNLYHKLGLHLKLKKQMVVSGNMMEYVLLVEFRPKVALFKPD